MVWARSSTGVSRRITRSDIPAQIPTGIPMSRATNTAVAVSARVSIACVHSPCAPMNRKPSTVRAATRALPTAHAPTPSTASTPSQPIRGRGRPKEGCAIRSETRVVAASMTRRMTLKK